MTSKKVKSAPLVIGEARGSSVPVLISSFCIMKGLEVFLLSLGGILFPRRFNLPPSICKVIPKTIC